MPDKNINIHIGVEGDEQTRRDAKGVAEAVENIGQKTETAGNKGRDAMGRFTKGTKDAGEEAKKSGGLFSGLFRKMASFAAGVVSINLVTDAIRKQTQALRENVEIMERQQKSLLRLQFLGDYYKEKPELRKETMALAEFGRRGFEEVANARYNLRSKNASLSENQQMGILREALEMGRTDPDMPLDTLIDMFSLYAKKSGTADANQVQNVLQKTIEEAGGSGSDVASYMPRFLPIGMSGGLTGAESAGLWAYATTQSGEASIATTGLKALFLGLQGKGTPESAKMLQGLGIDTGGDFFSKIGQLSRAKASGTFGLAQAEQLAGREGADILLSILDDPQGLMRTIQSVTSADRADIDLTKNKLEGLFGTDEVAKAEEDKRLLNIKIENVRAADPKARETEKWRKQFELEARKAGVPEAVIGAADMEIGAMQGLGADPLTLEFVLRYLAPFLAGDPVTAGARYGYDMSRDEPLTLMNERPVEPTVINNNHNVVYNHPASPARARVAPEDIE